MPKPYQPCPLLSAPHEIRTLIYDELFCLGRLITIGLEIKTTFSSSLVALRINRQINQELSAYLNGSKPIVLYCARDNRPSVIHKIPRRVLNQAEVVVIEDKPDNILELKLLPKLRSVCFCDVFTYYFSSPLGGDGQRLQDGEEGTAAHAQLHTTIERQLTLPENNDVLRVHQDQWKELRLQCLWIRTMWKSRADIQIVLRRVTEVVSEEVVQSYHTVVNVNSRSVLEKCRLPACNINENVVFEYGTVAWWTKDNAKQLL